MRLFGSNSPSRNRAKPDPITIDGPSTLGIEPGQFHAHKLERVKNGVFFDWYTVDPDVLLPPFLISSARFVVARHRRVAWKIPHRLIADPLNNVNEPDSQTGGGTDAAPTVVNKRKHTASTSLSQSSSASSSTPSSPTSDVDREESIPGERLMFKLPRRAQMVKRPRLGLAPSGGGVTALSVQARQTLAPPPVFRRRPSTPFNCPPGETDAIGDQGEGSGHIGGNGSEEFEAGGNSPDIRPAVSSDESLDSPLRLR